MSLRPNAPVGEAPPRPADALPPPPPRAAVPPRPALPPSPGPRSATRAQRLGLALGLLAAFIFALWFFSAILTPFVLAICVAYFLDPVAGRLARIGVPRWLGAGLLIMGLMALALVALVLLYPLLISQIGVLLTRLPSYVATIGAKVADLLAAAEEAMEPMAINPGLKDLAVSQVGSMLVWLGTSATRLIGGGYALFNVFTFAVVTPIVGFYLLRDWPRLMARIESWLPRRNAAVLRQLAHDTDRVLSAWLRGQLLCCALLAVYYALALSAVGLELGLLVGLLAGMLTFIPYVGSLTGMATAILLAIGQFGNWRQVAVVMGVFLLGQIVEGYIIYPRLLGNRVELHAVWVIFALFAGGVAFGFLGVLLAVPIAAAIGVLARYWLRRYLESPLYLDPPRTGG
ncbi:AI-2E family transporter [Roseomonas chloroacetimidivorans]|uniref:AI-2E family transporter n=1 Tax=Roseomonas chloroacetimidivorans TaxID=1766656 RepID=UPI003C75EE4B